MKRIMVDMSATIIHHGHIRLLKHAKKIGHTVVALTLDEEIKKYKGYVPELKFQYRLEIMESIKYVDEVVSSPWLINDEFLDLHNIDFLIHGHDNSNKISEDRIKIIKRTPDISSSKIREKIIEEYFKKKEK
tara:strand:+ start:14 stop:409 length:396 start_codon:yes stop_codon:yes gene_type:complete